MSGSHKEFPKKAVFLQLGLAALVGIGFLTAEKPAAIKAVTDKVTKPIVEAAAKILSPIGKVEVKTEKTASAARSGKEVYDSTCGTCHNTGIAGAPKVEDAAAWESRLSGGFSALVSSAINGKGGMPARGGNPDITDSEMELAVSHMIKEAGIDLVPRSAAGSSNSATTATTTVAATTPTAPKVKTTVAATSTTETMAVDHSAGEKVYKNSCFACHASGIAGSPKVGDKAAWTDRIAAGVDSMYDTAINGKGAMPAKGGNMSLSDADIKAAVDYMAAKSM